MILYKLSNGDWPIRALFVIFWAKCFKRNIEQVTVRTRDDIERERGMRSIQKLKRVCKKKKNMSWLHIRMQLECLNNLNNETKKYPCEFFKSFYDK